MANSKSRSDSNLEQHVVDLTTVVENLQAEVTQLKTRINESSNHFNDEISECKTYINSLSNAVRKLG